MLTFRLEMMFRLPGQCDNEGRLLLNFFLARSRPHGRPLAHLLAYSMFEVDYWVETESLSRLRNGCLWICNMEGFSMMKNIDMSAEGRKWGAAVSGNFPNRIRGALIFRVGWLARVILAAAKILFPKKIAKRFTIVKEVDIAAQVPKQHLLKEYGGEMEPNFELMWASHEAVAKKLEKRWKKIRKALRAEARAAAAEEEAGSTPS